MDLATLIGAVAAWALIIATIALGSDALVFINALSIMIVLGGTFAVVMMRFTLSQLLGAFKTAGEAFSHKGESAE